MALKHTLHFILGLLRLLTSHLTRLRGLHLKRMWQWVARSATGSAVRWPDQSGRPGDLGQSAFILDEYNRLTQHVAAAHIPRMGDTAGHRVRWLTSDGLDSVHVANRAPYMTSPNYIYVSSPFSPDVYPMPSERRYRNESHAHHRHHVEQAGRAGVARRGLWPIIESEPSSSPISTGVLHSGADRSLPSKRTREMYAISFINRYGRNSKVSDEQQRYHVLPPMTAMFNLNDVPMGWMNCEHPDGALYFYHREQRIFTDAHLCKREIFDEIQTFILRLEQRKQEFEYDFQSPSVECVLELEERPEPRRGHRWRWCYYFVDYTKRILFWLDTLNLKYDPDYQKVRGVESPSHIKHWMNSRYWSHWEMFPALRRIPGDVILDVMGTLTYGAIDHISTDEGIMPYSAQAMQDMLYVVQIASNLWWDVLPLSSQPQEIVRVVDNRNTAHGICSIARLMTVFALHRFRNFHGQGTARLSRSQAIYNSADHDTMFIRLVSPWFFGAPDVQLRSLRKIWVDNFMLYPDWSDFIEKMKSEWSDFLLPSTVSLSTNVAFLAIPNLSMDNSSLNAAQILSYISMTVSMGSIIMTLLLTRQNGHHLRMRETAFKVVLFLRNRRHPRLGLEALAVVYSLPYGLILWAVITFLAAFSFVCFGGNDTLAMSTTGAVWIIIAMLVVWSLYIGRETKSLPKWLIKAFSFCGTDKSSAANGSKPSDCDGTTVM